MSDVFTDNFECELENLLHTAADIGWDKAAKAAENHLNSPPEDDEWMDDYETAVRLVADAFRAAFVEHCNYRKSRSMT